MLPLSVASRYEKSRARKRGNMKEKLKKLKAKIAEASSDVTYYKTVIKEKSEKFDELEEKVVKILDSIQDLSDELYECYEELKVTEDEITEIKDLCDEIIEEEEE